MAIRYPKEVHEFIQANYYGRRPEELAVLVNKKFSSGYTPAQMKSYVKNRKLPNDLPRKQIYSDVFPKEVVKYINKNYIGAWRCDEFSCGNYSDSDYDCNNNLCHVCATGQKCLNCDNFEDCEFGKENMKIQKMRNSKG